MESISEYLKILEESLAKKVTILQALLESSLRQSELAEAEDFDFDAFQNTMDQKDALLAQLEELDQGFEQVFLGVQTELNGHKELHREEIHRMQQLIRKCTDLGVELQATEERNKTKLAAVFAAQQREIRQVKTSSKVASTYYKSMSGNKKTDSIFLDQKK